MLRSLKRATRHKATIDRSRVDAMTEAERHAAAMADPDAKADDGIKNGIVRLGRLYGALSRLRLRLAGAEGLGELLKVGSRDI